MLLDARHHACAASASSHGRRMEAQPVAYLVSVHMPVTASVPLQLCVTAPRVGGDFTKPNTKTDQQVLHFASTAPSSQPIAYTLAPLEVSCYQTLPLEHALHADWAV